MLKSTFRDITIALENKLRIYTCKCLVEQDTQAQPSLRGMCSGCIIIYCVGHNSTKLEITTLTRFWKVQCRVVCLTLAVFLFLAQRNTSLYFSHSVCPYTFSFKSKLTETFKNSYICLYEIKTHGGTDIHWRGISALQEIVGNEKL